MAEESESTIENENQTVKPPLTPTRIFLRGLAVSLPAILTVLILLWLFEKANNYLITPATWAVKFSIATLVDQSVRLHDPPLASEPQLVRIEGAPHLRYCGDDYLVTPDLRNSYQNFLENEPPVDEAITAEKLDAGEEITPMDAYAIIQDRRAAWMQERAERVPSGVFVPFKPYAVPYDVYFEVSSHFPPGGPIPTSARAIYMEYVARKYLGSVFPLSLLTVVIFVILFYFAGQFVSAKIGSWMIGVIESQVFGRLPVVRNVYGSVKQVTDFVFTENQPVEYRRVAAVQYPRKGIWTIGFVTGDSMMQIALGAGEPCVAVLIPTSPMPMTGFTVNIPKSEILDLDITVEQAMQFCISCGVLSPAHQKLTAAKYKEFVEQGLIRASLSQSPSFSDRAAKAFPVKPNLSPPPKPLDDGEDE